MHICARCNALFNRPVFSTLSEPTFLHRTLSKCRNLTELLCTAHAEPHTFLQLRTVSSRLEVSFTCIISMHAAFSILKCSSMHYDRLQIEAQIICSMTKTPPRRYVAACFPHIQTTSFGARNWLSNGSLERANVSPLHGLRIPVPEAPPR